MSIPSYTTLISGIVDGLKDDTDLTGVVSDEFIYYGPQGDMVAYPTITVELAEANEEWKTFPKGKDLEATFIIRIYDEAYDYVSGLQSVENIARLAGDVLQKKTGYSGLVYQSYPGRKSFGTFEINDVPLFGCELEMLTKARFAPAT